MSFFIIFICKNQARSDLPLDLSAHIPPKPLCLHLQLVAPTCTALQGRPDQERSLPELHRFGCAFPSLPLLPQGAGGSRTQTESLLNATPLPFTKPFLSVCFKAASLHPLLLISTLPGFHLPIQGAATTFEGCRAHGQEVCRPPFPKDIHLSYRSDRVDTLHIPPP